MEKMILHKIFREVSRFPHYISYNIGENRFLLGQCNNSEYSTMSWEVVWGHRSNSKKRRKLSEPLVIYNELCISGHNRALRLSGICFSLINAVLQIRIYFLDPNPELLFLIRIQQKAKEYINKKNISNFRPLNYGLQNCNMK